MSTPDSSGQCFYFGTFNPIHAGHLMIAQSALSQLGPKLGFHRITFMPAGNPPHRYHQGDLLDAASRLKMVQLATAEHPAFTVSDFESRDSGRSYTMETLRKMERQGLITYPVPFIIGSDALANLATWHQPEALIEKVHFLQAPRPDYDWVESVILNGKEVSLNTSRIDLPPLAISSSWVRQTLRTASTIEPLRFYLPEPVRRFIGWNRLYKNSGL